MQGTQIQSLALEDPSCCGATKWMSCNYRAHREQLLKLLRLEPALCNKRSTTVRSPHTAVRVQPSLTAPRESRNNKDPVQPDKEQNNFLNEGGGRGGSYVMEVSVACKV